MEIFFNENLNYFSIFFGGKQFLQKNYMEKKIGEKKGEKKRTCYPLMKKGRIP
jgi:hypothetical protein